MQVHVNKPFTKRAHDVCPGAFQSHKRVQHRVQQNRHGSLENLNFRGLENLRRFRAMGGSMSGHSVAARAAVETRQGSNSTASTSGSDTAEADFVVVGSGIGGELIYVSYGIQSKT